MSRATRLHRSQEMCVQNPTAYGTRSHSITTHIHTLIFFSYRTVNDDRQIGHCAGGRLPTPMPAPAPTGIGGPGATTTHQLGINKTDFPRRTRPYPRAVPSAAARKTQGARSACAAADTSGPSKRHAQRAQWPFSHHLRMLPGSLFFWFFRIVIAAGLLAHRLHHAARATRQHGG